MRILIDTNVLVDYIENRQSFSESAEKIINACADEKIEGYIAAHSVSNLFYILRKHYTVQERRRLLKSMCTILSVVGIDHEKIMDALDDDGFDDFEDCLQEKCAVEFGADYIVTRNIKDFENTKVKCLDAEEFVRTILTE